MFYMPRCYNVFIAKRLLDCNLKAWTIQRKKEAVSIAMSIQALRIVSGAKVLWLDDLD